MKKTWPVQDAKARFSEFLKASLTEGPQVVTLRGVETAVLLPVSEWLSLVSEPALVSKPCCSGSVRAVTSISLSAVDGSACA